MSGSAVIPKRRLRIGCAALWMWLVAFPVAAQPSPEAQGQSDQRSDAPSPASAEEARLLFERGVVAADAQRWAEAEQSFARSYAVLPMPTTLLNLALARHQLGDHASALRALDELDVLIAQEALRARALALRRVIEPLVARYTVRVDADTAVVAVDGVVEPGQGREHRLVLAPGAHEVTVSAPGLRPRTLSISLETGTSTQAFVALVPEPELSPAPVMSAPVQASAQRDGVTSRSSTTRVDQAPRSRRLYQNPWFWTVLGTAVVAGGVGAGMLLRDRESSQERPSGGTTGLVF